MDLSEVETTAKLRFKFINKCHKDNNIVQGRERAKTVREQTWEG